MHITMPMAAVCHPLWRPTGLAPLRNAGAVRVCSAPAIATLFIAFVPVARCPAGGLHVARYS